jgi:hypothetical protein
MNTIDFYNSISEENVLAIFAFLGAGAFYMMRLTKIMRSRIQEFEDRDAHGRDAFKSDIDLLQGIEERIGLEHRHVKNNIENELVEYELAAYALNPRLKAMSEDIRKAKETEIRFLKALGGEINSMPSAMDGSLYDQPRLEDIRAAVPQAMEIVRQLQVKLTEQRVKTQQLSADVSVIKNGYGVE